MKKLMISMVKLLRRGVLKVALILALAGLVLTAGCCESNPNSLAQIRQGFQAAQTVAYGADGNLLPTVVGALNDPRVKEGVAAADLALALGSMAQNQWCGATPQIGAQVTAAAATAAANLPPK